MTTACGRILWLGLWRYRHPFMWVRLHHAGFSLPGHSWHSEVDVLGVLYLSSCSLHMRLHVIWGIVQSVSPSDSVPFSLTKNKKHQFKDRLLGCWYLFCLVLLLSRKCRLLESYCAHLCLQRLSSGGEEARTTFLPGFLSFGVEQRNLENEWPTHSSEFKMLSPINWKCQKSFCPASPLLHCSFLCLQVRAEDISIKFAEFTVEGHRELSARLTSAPLLVQTCSTWSACCWTAHPGTSQTTRWRISYSSSPNANKRTSSKCDHWSKRHGLISFFVLSYYQPSKREIINTVTLNYITISCSSYLYCFYFLKLNEELSPVSLGSQRDLVFILSRYTWASAEWWFVL